MRVLVFVLLLIAISGLILINNHNLHLAKKEELKTFSELYYNWVSKIYSNFFSMTGHFSKLDWAPK